MIQQLPSPRLAAASIRLPITRLPSWTPQWAFLSASTTRMVGAPYIGSVPSRPMTAAFIRVSWARVSGSCTTTILALWRPMALGA